MKFLFQAYYFHLITISIIFFLAFFNYKNRLKLQELYALEYKNNTYLENIKYNYFLSSLSGNIFPFKNKLEELKIDEVGGHKFLVIVANFRVCSVCLRDELNILNDHYDVLKEENIFPVIVFGLKSYTEKDIILRYKKQNYLNKLPYVIVDYSQLNNFIPLLYKDKVTYIENPQYLLLDSSYQVIDAFKPPKFESDFLREWISKLYQ